MKKIDQVKELLLIVKSLGFDNVVESKFDEAVSSVFNPNNNTLSVIYATEMNVDGTDVGEYFFVVHDRSDEYNNDKIQEIIQEKINENIVKLDEIKKIFLIEIFRSIEVKCKVNKYDGSRKRELRRKIKSALGISLENIEYCSYVIPDVLNHEKKLKINITDRIRSLENEYNLDDNEKPKEGNLGKEESKKEKNDKSVYMKSYVFTAELDSVIELYDIFGDNLFSKNVRIGGIKDNTGIDNDIINTYIYKPNEFWFLNNGISLFIETNKSINFNIYNSVSIDLDGIDNISVINGAQTIKAVSEARYFENKERKGKAMVLLRMYIYENNLEKDDETIRKIRDFSEKVTVALNKQKPIKQVDLAYITNFVKNMQNIKDMERKDTDIKGLAFAFVRRGEAESVVLCQYQLDMFAKIVKAYLLKKPGKARSQSYSTLLAIDELNSREDKSQGKQEEEEFKNKEYKLKDSDIFLDFFQKKWDEGKNDEQKKEFLKYYSPVNFAMKLKEYLEEKVDGKDTNLQVIEKEFIDYKKDKKDILDGSKIEKLQSCAKYGTLLMVSVVVNKLNRFGEDYAEWKYRLVLEEEKSDKNTDETVVNIKKLKELMYSVFDSVVEYENEGEQINDSNFWKKDNITGFVIDKLKKDKSNSSVE
jgi:hypothetical protein